MERFRFSRRVGIIGGSVVVVLGCAIFWLSGSRYIETENAYVHAAHIMVTTDVSGLIRSVSVRQGQHVKKGDVLFRLEPQEFQHTVDADRAALHQQKLNLDALKHDYQGALGAIRAQEAVLRLAKRTYTRDSALAEHNAISVETLDHAREALQEAEGTLIRLKRQAAASLASLNNDPALPAEKYPPYKEAVANLAEAKRQLDHSVVRAPFDGTVGEVDALQPGALIVSSLSSFSTTSAVGFVSDKNIWIRADLKESKLTYLRPGQPVDVTVDSYPGVHWHGHVEAISPGSDNTFSVLPAQNSSANWVKIVQRIPVRIAIDQKPGQPVLRAGMSSLVTIDTGHRRWWRLLHGDRQ